MFGGSTISKYVEGYTTLKSIFGKEINSSIIQSCDRNIGQAIIYISPYVSASTHTLTQRKGILMHEMGHAMGLGHHSCSDSRNSYSADSYGSIMDYSYTEEYPTVHDICDIEIILSI
ncbi:M12 family metallo-peptidase [Caldicellulosiruptor morganii]|uniref:M12 family metallo-peptidase n=1 Tax=Caldicellulosiruptor morganii TaxID=1387555 RepID=A0ABY7BQS4_9FIRM|nr:M12 family metallo-peptidase [Caldicellulosiruptor morganii]WAM33789.1 M12 family metallo-peptidase [Caldicellulosiruptor morganii]